MELEAPAALLDLYCCSFSSAHSVCSSLSHTPLNVPCWASRPLLKWKRARGTARGTWAAAPSGRRRRRPGCPRGRPCCPETGSSGGLGWWRVVGLVVTLVGGLRSGLPLVGLVVDLLAGLPLVGLFVGLPGCFALGWVSWHPAVVEWSHAVATWAVRGLVSAARSAMLARHCRHATSPCLRAPANSALQLLTRSAAGTAPPAGSDPRRGAARLTVSWRLSRPSWAPDT
jgi:hypothetical protein